MRGRRRTPERASARQPALVTLVFGPAAAVLVVVILTLALTPWQIPSPDSLGGAAVVLAVICGILLANLLLMHRALAPLGRLTSLMRRIDPLDPGQRIPRLGRSREVLQLVGAFNEMLDRLESERRASARRALAAEQDERRRVSRELHDEVGQDLTGLLLMLDGLARKAPDESVAELEEARESARSNLEHVRTVARRLRPEELDHLGLVAALESLAQRASERSGLVVERDLMREPPELDPQQELVIFRIAQESLTNAMRHAGASRVRVELGPRGNRQLALSVTDDGAGFAPRPGGSGIRGMRERALLVGGELSIRAASSGGTAVQLVVPLEQASVPGRST